jgi:hypothetical protein
MFHTKLPVSSGYPWASRIEAQLRGCVFKCRLGSHFRLASTATDICKEVPPELLQIGSVEVACHFPKGQPLRNFIKECGNYSLESCRLLHVGHMRRVGEKFPARPEDSFVDLAHHVWSRFVVLPGYKKSRH